LQSVRKRLDFFVNILTEEGYSYRKRRASSAFVIDRVEMFLTSSLITMHNLVVSHAVRAHVGGLNFWETLGTRPLGLGVWLT